MVEITDDIRKKVDVYLRQNFGIISSKDVKTLIKEGKYFIYINPETSDFFYISSDKIK